MYTRGAIILPRQYRGAVAPPAAIEDTSRHGNDGTLTGAWLREPSGQWVCDFAAGGESVFAYDPSFNAPSAWTICAWVYPPDLSGNRTYFERTSYTLLYRASGDAVGRIRVAVYHTGGAGFRLEWIYPVLDIYNFIAWGITSAGRFFWQLNDTYSSSALVGFTGLPVGNVNLLQLNSPNVTLSRVNFLGHYNYAFSQAQLLRMYDRTKGLYRRQ